jgi:hypothetical protein
LQREELAFKALSIDGLPITVRLAWRYAIKRDGVGRLHKYLGPNYQQVLLIPTIAEQVRNVVSKHHPEDIWSRYRTQVTSEIVTETRAKLRDEIVDNVKLDVVNLDAVLLIAIDLPKDFEQAVVDKQVANQKQLEWDYHILREKKEAERRAVEALGIRNFQDVVSYSLTDSYLRWRGIQATLELAKSKNAKIVIIGNPGNGGLPLILGNVDGLREPAGDAAPDDTSAGRLPGMTDLPKPPDTRPPGLGSSLKSPLNQNELNTTSPSPATPPTLGPNGTVPPAPAQPSASGPPAAPGTPPKAPAPAAAGAPPTAPAVPPEAASAPAGAPAPAATPAAAGASVPPGPINDQPGRQHTDSPSAPLTQNDEPAATSASEANQPGISKLGRNEQPITAKVPPPPPAK